MWSSNHDVLDQQLDAPSLPQHLNIDLQHEHEEQMFLHEQGHRHFQASTVLEAHPQHCPPHCLFYQGMQSVEYPPC